MIRGLLVGLLALGCLSVGEGLQCYSCPLGTCILPSTVSCPIGQMCGTATGSVSTALGAFSLKTKGCIGIFRCLSWETETYGGVEFSMSNSCCFGSLCNSSTSARPSLLTGLVALLSVLLMKFL